MKGIERLTRLDAYLASLKAKATDGTEADLRAVMTIAQADATSRLSRLSGQQVLAARSELSQAGGTDSYTVTLSTAVFVLEKGLGTGRTEEAESAQFARLAALAGEVLERITNDISSGSCSLLAGLDLVSVDITPESSLFGGWTGYSLDLSFR